MVMMPLVADDRARLFRLARAPNRIVSLAPNATEVVLALGLASRLVGVDEHSEVPAGHPCIRVGGFKTTDVGTVTALRPELVVAASIHVGRVIPALEEAGHAVFLLWPRSVSGLLRTVLRLGTLTGVAETATTLVHGLEARVQRITEILLPLRTRPLVYLELSPQGHTAGPGTFLDDAIGRAGGINLGMAARGEWPVLGPELIRSQDPDVIVLAAYPGSASLATVRTRPGWARLKAVRSGRVYDIHGPWLKRGGVSLVAGLEALARCLHPDRVGIDRLGAAVVAGLTNAGDRSVGNGDEDRVAPPECH